MTISDCLRSFMKRGLRIKLKGSYLNILMALCIPIEMIL